MRTVVKILDIPHARAKTGMKFKKRSAVPIFDGVVVAADYEEACHACYNALVEQQLADAQVAHSELILGYWYRFLTALRIRNRLDKHFGVIEDADSDIEKSSDSSSVEGGFVK